MPTTVHSRGGSVFRDLRRDMKNEFRSFVMRPEDFSDDYDFRGMLPESWHCVDCGVNTAPGYFNRVEMENAAKELGKLWQTGTAGIEQRVNNRSEVYGVRDKVWKQAGMEPMGGCLCIGCLEQRIGRRLKPKDFQRGDPLNVIPGTPRLLQRQGR